MTKASKFIGGARVGLVIAGGMAALTAAGCGDMGDESLEAAASQIIGGSAPLSVATQRSLGLIQFGCSSALMNKDWVLTASHCVNFANVPGMVFSAPRTDSGVDQRLGSYAVQVGGTDMTMIKLGTAQAGNMWPNVTHPVTTSAASSFVNTNITCYGAGANAYDPDGAGVIGFGVYQSISKLVLSLTTPAPPYGEYYTVTSANGQNVLSWGDSGSNCFTSGGQVLAVHSGGNCTSWQGMGQPNDPGCNPTTVIQQKDNWLSATASYRAYMTEALTRAGMTFEPVPLINGWAPGAYGANGVGAGKKSGVVTLRGGISLGTAQKPFVLPAAYRPSFGRVYVPTSTTNGSIGRAIIEANGDVNIECEGGPGFCQNSSHFTSFDGVSYIQDPAGVTPLALQNGWATAQFGNRNPGVRVVNGQVHFIGGMVTAGTNTQAFTLPTGFRPTVPVWVPVSLCWSAKGRLNIATTGVVTVQVENNAWASAQCFTSLEGASFALSATSGTAPTLVNGWTNGSFGSGQVRVVNDNGVVRFKGATSGGTAAHIMTLPAAFRPATNVWIYVDNIAGKRGRILVTPSGAVSVDGTDLASAQGFLSFEGAEFGI